LNTETKTPTEGELIRFRVDAAVKDKVAEVCEKLGFDLADVLRAFMARVAQEGMLPFELGAPAETRAERAPFTEYSERLWRDYRSVDAEVAVVLLTRFIADCGAQLAAEDTAARRNPELTGLRQELGVALDALERLDPADGEAVAAVLARYGPRVAGLK
jgi:DNA-damage-inducible protein J